MLVDLSSKARISGRAVPKSMFFMIASSANSVRPELWLSIVFQESNQVTDAAGTGSSQLSLVFSSGSILDFQLKLIVLL